MLFFPFCRYQHRLSLTGCWSWKEPIDITATDSSFWEPRPHLSCPPYFHPYQSHRRSWRWRCRRHTDHHTTLKHITSCWTSTSWHAIKPDHSLWNTLSHFCPDAWPRNHHCYQRRPVHFNIQHQLLSRDPQFWVAGAHISANHFTARRTSSDLHGSPPQAYHLCADQPLRPGQSPRRHPLPAQRWGWQ